MPRDSDTEEINSFMYQSAAHSIIPLLAQCFSVPLIRHTINGSAVVQSLNYDHPQYGDEVEDLYYLLKIVIDKYPDVKGVSCGAIASSYQRLRVEHVCQRLKLQPLSYLWLRDRKELLTEMIDANVDAIFVKVAGAGLDPCRHLGKHLNQSLFTLLKLNEKYGLDLCGEGGEYETFVLDLPQFKSFIRVLRTDVVLDEEDEDASVGNLRILNAELESKLSADYVSVYDSIATIPSFEEKFHARLSSWMPLAIRKYDIMASNSQLRTESDVESVAILERLPSSALADADNNAAVHAYNAIHKAATGFYSFVPQVMSSRGETNRSK